MLDLHAAANGVETLVNHQVAIDAVVFGVGGRVRGTIHVALILDSSVVASHDLLLLLLLLLLVKKLRQLLLVMLLL